MTTTLRVVLDQLVAPTDPDLAMVSRELTRALIATAPRGCEVAAAVPALAEDAGAPLHAIEGLASIEASRVPRKELSTALSRGLPSGLGSGMLHSPTLFAPLVRHDRVHNHDQTVVTIWDLTPWTHPSGVSKSSAAWHRAMLTRAERYADAVVVPLHAMAEELSERTKLAGRIRVIAGAAPAGFAPPRDEVGRRRDLGVPEGAVVIDSAGVDAEELREVVAAIGRELDDSALVILGLSGEMPASGALALPSLDADDRAAVLASASVLVAPSARPRYDWRMLEALTLGLPVVALGTSVHRELLVEGGVCVEEGRDGLSAATAQIINSDATRDRARTLSADRGRAFSWHEAGERVWQLHAEL